MRYFPMFFDLRGRGVLLAGGGEQIAQKARLLTRTEARLEIMAAEIDEELAGHVASGRASHVAKVYDEAAIDRAALLFAASGCCGIDAMIAARGRARGVVVNVIDRPALCDVITPALVDRDPLVVAIGTEGAAPVMAREVKTRLETMLEPEIGGLVALAGRLRETVAETVPPVGRRAFWEWVFEGPPRRLWQEGAEAEAEAAIRARAAEGGAGGSAALVSVIALPGEVDLLPLRAVQRLQSAGIVLHPPGRGAEVLELARRDAERATLATGGTERVADQLRAACAEHARVVVLLTAGDTDTPALRAALEAEGIACEPIGAG
ncbi:siroheme synthase [Oceanicella sp. SM1341]|uniref:siroheme synthase n=1 Tax=Oceanicella sp. SM1341 TaxID=1548889 RepID=UPI001300ACAD|nr:NAD(P)-dependent oxidoreductase [Oceanicella sp. SM1341]